MTKPCDMTTGEAEAFRRGFEAAREAAEAIARPQEMMLMRAVDYDTRQEIAAAIRAMEPPA